MATIDNQMLMLMYILLGSVAAMLYALRRIFLLERKILGLEKVLLDFDGKLAALLKKKK